MKLLVKIKIINFYIYISLKYIKRSGNNFLLLTVNFSLINKNYHSPWTKIAIT